jgi:hypothetical protein
MPHLYRRNVSTLEPTPVYRLSLMVLDPSLDGMGLCDSSLILGEHPLNSGSHCPPTGGTVVKERQSCECPFGSSSFCGFVEPRQQGHQAPLSAAESSLALDGWRTGNGTHSKLKTELARHCATTGTDADLDGSKRIYPL